jgi:hypothetical protein
MSGWPHNFKTCRKEPTDVPGQRDIEAIVAEFLIRENKSVSLRLISSHARAKCNRIGAELPSGRRIWAKWFAEP